MPTRGTNIFGKSPLGLKPPTYLTSGYFRTEAVRGNVLISPGSGQWHDKKKSEMGTEKKIRRSNLPNTGTWVTDPAFLLLGICWVRSPGAFFPHIQRCTMNSHTEGGEGGTGYSEYRF